MPTPCDLTPTLAAAEEYIETRLFDPYGIMYAYIDIQTGEPFGPGVITPVMTPVRAHFDPWSYWTYEDSICVMGMYLDTQAYKYRLTRDTAHLEKGLRVWRQVQKIYFLSQVYSPGCFLRPYGGLRTMEKFMEPLGTDQAGPLFHGLYAFMQHVDAATQQAMAEVLLGTLTWYERQGFKYLYYKCFLHEWNAGAQHATSYYLPAIAWAAQWTGEQKWKNYLEEKAEPLRDGTFCLFRDGQGAFCWGTDLPTLATVSGADFERFVTRQQLQEAYDTCVANLQRYDAPQRSRYFHAAARLPGFTPSTDPMEPPYARDGGIGYQYFYTVHQGRHHPRHETHFMCALAGLGQPGALEQAWELLGIRRNVPHDFTEMLNADYEQLPEAVRLCARAVGVGIVEWVRNYWYLKWVEAGAK